MSKIKNVYKVRKTLTTSNDSYKYKLGSQIRFNISHPVRRAFGDVSPTSSIGVGMTNSNSLGIESTLLVFPRLAWTLFLAQLLMLVSTGGQQLDMEEFSL